MDVSLFTFLMGIGFGVTVMGITVLILLKIIERK